MSRGQKREREKNKKRKKILPFLLRRFCFYFSFEQGVENGRKTRSTATRTLRIAKQTRTIPNKALQGSSDDEGEEAGRKNETAALGTVEVKRREVVKIAVAATAVAVCLTKRKRERKTRP